MPEPKAQSKNLNRDRDSHTLLGHTMHVCSRSSELGPSKRIGMRVMSPTAAGPKEPFSEEAPITTQAEA